MKKSKENYLLLRQTMRSRNCELLKSTVRDENQKIFLITNDEFVIKNMITVFLKVKRFSKNGEKKPCRKIAKKIHKWVWAEIGKEQLLGTRVVVETTDGKNWIIKVRCHREN